VLSRLFQCMTFTLAGKEAYLQRFLALAGVCGENRRSKQRCCRGAAEVLQNSCEVTLSHLFVATCVHLQATRSIALVQQTQQQPEHFSDSEIAS
jgi:hypothetical protein